jgi:hypothetical protein
MHTGHGQQCGQSYRSMTDPRLGCSKQRFHELGITCIGWCSNNYMYIELTEGDNVKIALTQSWWQTRLGTTRPRIWQNNRKRFAETFVQYVLRVYFCLFIMCCWTSKILQHGQYGLSHLMRKLKLSVLASNDIQSITFVYHLRPRLHFNILNH